MAKLLLQPTNQHRLVKPHHIPRRTTTIPTRNQRHNSKQLHHQHSQPKRQRNRRRPNLHLGHRQNIHRTTKPIHQNKNIHIQPPTQKRNPKHKRKHNPNSRRLGRNIQLHSRSRRQIRKKPNNIRMAQTRNRRPIHTNRKLHLRIMPSNIPNHLLHIRLQRLRHSNRLELQIQRNQPRRQPRTNRTLKLRSRKRRHPSHSTHPSN